MRTPRIADRSITSPSSTTAVPATLCPPPRTAIGSPCLRGEAQGGRDVVGVGAARDRGRALVDHAVPHAAGGLVVGVTGRDDLAGEALGEIGGEIVEGGGRMAMCPACSPAVRPPSRPASGIRPARVQGRVGSASVLEVRLLGGLSAALDGRPVELPADARARELLARLALSPGPHPRSALAGRLRPDVPEESARKTLRNALYELRRALGPAGRDAMVVTGQRVGLSDSVRVDVREFRRCLADGDLEAAAAAGHGHLLDGLDGDWALSARDEHAAELAGSARHAGCPGGGLRRPAGRRRAGSPAPGRRAAVRGGPSRADPPARARWRSPGGARRRAGHERALALPARDPTVGRDACARRGRP